MEVILTPENEAALRSYIHEIITDEIAKARRDASVDKRVLKQIEIAKYFGVSTTTIRKWEDKGLPFGRIGGQKFYDKEKCRAWVLAQ
ncbi:MerR family transcriptional regulator [Enterococcus hirae]|uniref:MerR family transcriptional regulator n=1 Tax=Enterococcus hirae TaxID=1354 RepID=UPI0029539937|nr:MerR family transcriptional regulator [Enterococcus hirae]MDV7801186.1 MerR family transcriptional regulator [Enterococcus hirae]